MKYGFVFVLKQEHIQKKACIQIKIELRKSYTNNFCHGSVRRDALELDGKRERVNHSKKPEFEFISTTTIKVVIPWAI